MQKSQKVGLWIASLAMIGLGTATVQAATHTVNARLSGTWDANGRHTTGRYFVGHSTEIPTDTISYLVFNLNSVKGKHVQDAVITVPGNNDWGYTVPWGGHPAGQTAFQFKTKTTGVAIGRFTNADILNGMPNPRDNWMIYHYEMSEENLSYAWYPDSHTHDFEITPFHGTRFPATLAKVQKAVDSGGDFIVCLVSGFGQTAKTEEYNYGTGLPFTTHIVLTFTTTN